MYNGGNLVRPFLVHKILGPRPSPPPPLSLLTWDPLCPTVCVCLTQPPPQTAPGTPATTGPDILGPARFSVIRNVGPGTTSRAPQWPPKAPTPAPTTTAAPPPNPTCPRATATSASLCPHSWATACTASGAPSPRAPTGGPRCGGSGCRPAPSQARGVPALPRAAPTRCPALRCPTCPQAEHVSSRCSNKKFPTKKFSNEIFVPTKNVCNNNFFPTKNFQTKKFSNKKLLDYSKLLDFPIKLLDKTFYWKMFYWKRSACLTTVIPRAAWPRTLEGLLCCRGCTPDRRIAGDVVHFSSTPPPASRLSLPRRMGRVLLSNSVCPFAPGWGLTPPPLPRTRISLWEKMKFTKGNIVLGCFWYTNFWTFWVPDPPPPPLPPLKQNSGEDLFAVEPHRTPCLCLSTAAKGACDMSLKRSPL